MANLAGLIVKTLALLQLLLSDFFNVVKLTKNYSQRGNNEE